MQMPPLYARSSQKPGQPSTKVQDGKKYLLPKQFPRYGWNILQAEATGSSTDMSVLIMTSSIDIISAETKKENDHK